MGYRPCYEMPASAIPCLVPGNRWTYVAALTSPSREQRRAGNRNSRVTGASNKLLPPTYKEDGLNPFHIPRKESVRTHLACQLACSLACQKPCIDQKDACGFDLQVGLALTDMLWLRASKSASGLRNLKILPCSASLRDSNRSFVLGCRPHVTCAAESNGPQDCSRLQPNIRPKRAAADMASTAGTARLLDCCPYGHIIQHPRASGTSSYKTSSQKYCLRCLLCPTCVGHHTPRLRTAQHIPAATLSTFPPPPCDKCGLSPRSRDDSRGPQSAPRPPHPRAAWPLPVCLPGHAMRNTSVFDLRFWLCVPLQLVVCTEALLEEGTRPARMFTPLHKQRRTPACYSGI